MKTQTQMWKEINEPKIEALITFFDKNGKPSMVMPIIDRAPKIKRKHK